MRAYRIFILFIFLIPLQLHSQFKTGGHYIGGSIGFWVKGSTPILGANYEYGLPQDNIGIFGIGGIFRYWRYSEDTKEYKQEITNYVAAGQVNYHFNRITNGKFSPYVGLVIGFNNATTKYTAFDKNSIIGKPTEYKNGLILWAQGGFRFFFTPKIAGTVRLGLGNLDFSTIELGIDYKLY